MWSVPQKVTGFPFRSRSHSFSKLPTVLKIRKNPRSVGFRGVPFKSASSQIFRLVQINLHALNREQVLLDQRHVSENHI